MAFSILTAVIFIAADQKPVGKGLILGAVFSVINFILMGETLPARLSASRGKAIMKSLGGIAFRYLLLAIPIVLAIKMDQFDLFAVILGLFIVQLTLLVDHIGGFILLRLRIKRQG